MKWLGVVAIDPGNTAGYVQGVVPMKGSTPHKVKRMKLRHAEQVTAQGINGASEEFVIALKLFKLIRKFKDQCEEKNIQVVVVLEDFNLRDELHSSEREGISPVRITSSLEALLWVDSDDGMEWRDMPWLIQPSTAKTTVTDDRLKRWGLWEVGKKHCRDAWRHFATFIRTGQDGSKGGTGLKRFRSGGKYK